MTTPNDVPERPTEGNITEEPPVGTQVTDRDGDVGTRSESGWKMTTRGGTVPGTFSWAKIRSRAPLRLTTDADRVRVGLPLERGTGPESFTLQPSELKAGDRISFTWDGTERITCTLVEDDSRLRSAVGARRDGFRPFIIELDGEWAWHIADVRREPDPEGERRFDEIHEQAASEAVDRDNARDPQANHDTVTLTRHDAEAMWEWGHLNNGLSWDEKVRIRAALGWGDET